jgi:hypothetical protein
MCPSFCQGAPNQNAPPIASQTLPERFCAPCRSSLQSTRAIDQASGEGHQDGKTKQAENGNQDRQTENGKQGRAINKGGRATIFERLPRKNVPDKFPGKLQNSSSRTAPPLNSPDRQPRSATWSGNQNGGAERCSRRASGSSAVLELTVFVNCPGVRRGGTLCWKLRVTLPFE